MKFAALICFSCSLFAADDRNFTGSWTLDPQRSEVHSLPFPPEASFSVDHQPGALRITADGKTRVYTLTGETSRQTIGSLSLSTQTKWEGAALLMNSLSTSGRQFALNERWRLGRDGITLTIRRVYHAGVGESESTLIYLREGAGTTAAPADSSPVALPTRPTPMLQQSYIVPAGTRMLLRVNQTISTKVAQQGDKLYLETAVPVAVDEKVIIPRGSQVTALVRQATRGGRGGVKGELALEFVSIICPNGAHREIRARMSSADGRPLDREEGSVRGQRDKLEDVTTVGGATGTGAAIGSIGGRTGVGAAAGAAAGLAGIFAKRGPDVELVAGSTVEMRLDRDLTYARTELP